MLVMRVRLRFYEGKKRGGGCIVTLLLLSSGVCFCQDGGCCGYGASAAVMTSCRIPVFVAASTTNILWLNQKVPT